MKRRRIDCAEPVDAALSWRGAGVVDRNPSLRLSPQDVWRATRTPEGPATLHLRNRPSTPGLPGVEAAAWGPGAEYLLERLPDLVGLEDRSAECFDPREEPLRSFKRRAPGLRVPRSGAFLEVLLPTIVAQKVAGREASRAYRRLVQAVGEPAPGPDLGLLLPPAPEAVAALGYEEFHPFGIEKRRADRLRRVAARARALEALFDLDRDAAYRRLMSLPGIGRWTAAKVMFRAWGDCDAVPVGDYNLPSLVSWNLAGEPRADDRRLLELLAPYGGHRGRVIQLLEIGGRRAPRYGPRRPLRRFARW